MCTAATFKITIESICSARIYSAHGLSLQNSMDQYLEAIIITNVMETDIRLILAQNRLLDYLHAPKESTTGRLPSAAIDFL